MINKFIALLFLSRDYAHRAHLKTESHAEHMALGGFYEDLTELVDTLSETTQGWLLSRGIQTRLDIPYMSHEEDGKQPSEVLASHMTLIQGTRKEAFANASHLQNIVDEIVALYCSTLYKLSLG